MLNSGMIPDAPPDNWLAAMRRKLGMQLFLRCHTFVILQTLATKELYSSCYGRLNDRVEVIGNGVDCRRFAPLNPRVRSQVRQLLGVSENALLVICVASVIPRKGTHLLLSAWRYVLERFPDAHLAVIGTVGRRATFHGDTAFLDAYADEIRTQISTLPCPASVVLWGQQVDNVESFLGSSDVFAFTSYQEGMPNAVLEAMASGLPCVLSAYRGFPANGDEFGVDGTHFIKASHDPTSIAASIIELLSSSERRASIGKAARNWMIETQDHPIILQRWATIIKRAISGWRGASLKRRSQDVVAAEP
jgi:glycosyltransferase involved in cell wall biosynthesis